MNCLLNTGLSNALRNMLNSAAILQKQLNNPNHEITSIWSILRDSEIANKILTWCSLEADCLTLACQ